MRVLVLTVVHTPLDARIHHRQVRALRDAGHEVVYAAPFTGYGIDPSSVTSAVETVDVRRAVGRRRLGALADAIRTLRAWSERVDVVVVHDPELLAAVALVPRGLPVVWDVHEDLAGSLADKPWLPPALRVLVAWFVRRIEAWAERRCALLLAEEAYAERFRGTHTVVPNLPPLPPATRGPVDDRVVYLGRVSRLRGAHELVAVGERLADEGVALDVIGPVDDDVAVMLRRAHDAGHLRFHGFVPNAEALHLVDGALAGLSLLHDHPNYRHSMPTKVVEYQSLGVPVVTTPLPAARLVVEEAGSGTVVPFEDVDAVVDAVLALRADRSLARTLGAAGRTDAENGRSWDAVAPRFVAAVESAAHRV